MELYDQDIEFHESRTKLACAVICCTFGTVLFGGIGTGLIPFDHIAPFVVWLSTVSLGLCAVASIRRFVRAGHPAVTLTDTGLKDRRVFSGTLAWKDIQGVDVVEIQGLSYLGLRVAPEVRATLGMTTANRLMTKIAFELPKDLLAINVALMDTNPAALREYVCGKAAASGVVRIGSPARNA